MKILLLSDIPPCENLTAGLVLSAMVRLVPRDAICCFAVVNPTLDLRLSPEFANIPLEIHTKPNENWSWLPRKRVVGKISSAFALAGETLTEAIVVRRLIDKAVRFGRDQEVDRVWAVLQGQTTIRMAKAVADQLGVPLHTHVWDPFSWWASANSIDGITKRRVQAMFDQAIRSSNCVATASEPMAELYRERFNVAAVPVISSHPSSMGQSPDLGGDEETPILIGMAGQFYAANEWLQLVHALRASNWRIKGRRVRVLVLGPQRPPGAADEHISYLGWKSQFDAAFILSKCDILYCPYPFDEKMAEVSKYSFPSKLVLYLAAGRPIVFHGPDYSSPAKYIRNKVCGLVANRLIATAIYNELERLVGDREAYRTMGLNAQSAFQTDFTLSSMKSAFDEFIGQPPNQGAALYDHNIDPNFAPGTNWALRSSRSTSVVGVLRKIARALRAERGRLGTIVKSVVRQLALRVPRLRELHSEIRGLYAENDRLVREISILEMENARLSTVVLDDPDGESNDADLHAMVQYPSPSLQFLHELHPATKILVLTRHTGGVAPAGMMPLSKSAFWTNDAVGHASLPAILEEHPFNLDIQSPRSPQDLAALGPLLRLTLEHGIERLVLSSQRPHDIVFVSQLAQLVSLRLSVVADAPGQLEIPTSIVDHVDVVYSSPA